jgi:hypothetical protein
MTADHARAIEESELVTKMAKGRQVTRLANISDPDVITYWFGTQFVPYDYQVGSNQFFGVIVPKSLADKYLAANVTNAH